MALPIEEYALIGDRRTAALVGSDGSLDWLCLPRFDSSACFAALLGTVEHGRWQLCPVGEHEVSRRYLDGSAVLETTFTTAEGVVTLTDLMPRGDGRADVVRRVEGVRGTVRMRHEWRVRLDYGAIVPWVRRQTVDGEAVITAIAGPDQLVLRGPRLPTADDHRHVDEFDVAEGATLTFSTTWLTGWQGPCRSTSTSRSTGCWSAASCASPAGIRPIRMRRNGTISPVRPALARR